MLATPKVNSLVGKTWRVQGIPAIYDQRTLRTLLISILSLDDNSEFTIRSLATSPYESAEKVATISFQEDPQILVDAGTELAISFGTDQPLAHGTERALQTVDLVFDCHFEDFTALNSFERQEDHKFE